MIAPARVAAYEVLHAVNARRTDLPHALAAARTRLADERDRALAGEIATGTLRWQGAFDHIVQAMSGRPLSRFDAEVLDILRLTMFQLLHLDRVPASAAVDDAVSLTRRAGKRSAAPLVNALLRRVSRERRRLPLPERPADSSNRAAALDYLSRTLSHPRWLAARWLDRYGLDSAESWMLFNNNPALLTLRANTLKTSVAVLAHDLRVHGVEAEPCRFAPDGLVVRHGNPLATPLASKGLFILQDEASQLVSDVAAARPGERVLDACASPGGKTLGMAASMLDRGTIVATDLRGARVDLLARTVGQSGATVVRVMRADAAQPLPFAPRFDLVLLDAPCSGLGTIRRDPDIKWRRSDEHFSSLTAVQLRMLEQTAAVVRPGGRLVYATCSSEPEENEQMVSEFLTRHLEFSASPAIAPVPLVDAAGYFRTLPFRDGLEAFFAAVLVKRGVTQ
jgi:16S rRNA (cytosine967-C5)-methyltransferase